LAKAEVLYSIATLEKNKKADGWDKRCEGDYFWLSAFYTNPDYAGKRIGLRMLDEIRDYSHRQNISTVMLDCFKDGGFLEDYYLKYGFKKIDENVFNIRVENSVPV
jgi:GNAT superfamily N-acetyltransferase